MAQDHLAPVEHFGPLEAYQESVRQALHEAFEENVRARVLREPSFRPESIVGVRERGGKFEIFRIAPTKHLWLYQVLAMFRRGQMGSLDLNGNDNSAKQIRDLEAELPPRPAEVPLERCAAPIDKFLAENIVDVWQRLLSEQRSSDLMGLDGETYYFSMPLEGREVTGEAWSPERGTRLGKLVRLVDAMDAYCRTRQDKHLSRASKLTNELLRHD